MDDIFCVCIAFCQLCWRRSYTVLPPSISLYHVSFQRNNQGAANNADLHLRQGTTKESQLRSNKCIQGVANEHQVRNTYEKPNPDPDLI
jgi:hypothetical protein